MTSIGELYIDLGIKGAEKTISSISLVEKGLKETASVSLEAKAAIVGTMYALQQLFSTSASAGQSLSNFSTVTGESAQVLQKYQYAARQVGASNAEVENSFKALQAAMSKTHYQGQAPAGMAQVQLKTGGGSAGDIQAYEKNPELLIQKLQEYAQKEKNVGLRNQTLRSFPGITDNIIAALDKGLFTPKALASAPAYDDRQIANLAKAALAWRNLGASIQKTIGDFQASKEGLQLVTDISNLTTSVLELVKAFLKLSKTLHLFKTIDLGFKDLGLLFGQISGATQAAIDVKNGTPVNKNDPFVKSTQGDIDYGKAKIGRILDSLEKIPSVFKSIWDDVLTGAGLEANQIKPGDKVSPTILEKKTINNVVVPGSANSQSIKVAPTPQIPAAAAVPIVKNQASTTGPQNTYNVAQNLNFSHDGKDARQTGNDLKTAIKQAFRQLPSQLMVT